MKRYITFDNKKFPILIGRNELLTLTSGVQSKNLFEPTLDQLYKLFVISLISGHNDDQIEMILSNDEISNIFNKVFWQFGKVLTEFAANIDNPEFAAKYKSTQK